MPESRMKSETEEEARKRMEALRESEKAGMQAAAEGQVQGAEPLMNLPAQEDQQQEDQKSLSTSSSRKRYETK